MKFKFETYASLKDSEDELDVTVEVTDIFYGAPATRFDPEEDAYLEFTVKDEHENDITNLINDYDIERIEEKCFEWGRDE
jgi:hypothetical protein